MAQDNQFPVFEGFHGIAAAAEASVEVLDFTGDELSPMEIAHTPQEMTILHEEDFQRERTAGEDSPECEAFNGEASNYATDMLRKYVSERNYELMSLKFGLDGKDPVDVIELAAYYGVTKQLIYFTISKSLHKLRSKGVDREIEGMAASGDEINTGIRHEDLDALEQRQRLREIEGRQLRDEEREREERAEAYKMKHLPGYAAHSAAISANIWHRRFVQAKALDRLRGYENGYADTAKRRFVDEARLAATLMAREPDLFPALEATVIDEV